MNRRQLRLLMTELPRKEINYKDGRTRSISVSIFIEGSYKTCGTIVFNSQQNVAGFTYHAHYDGPPLDPINLNYLRTGMREFAVDRRINNDLLHRVFVDYLPGIWGVNLLQAEYPEMKGMRAAERLHWFGTRTVGSLAFFVKHLEDENPVRGIDRLETIRRRSMDFFLKKMDSSEASQWEMNSLSSHGGARPKCMFADKSGGQWLVKFNIDHDAYNYARVEHAVAVMAKRCGIDVVETRCVTLSSDADMLFVRRYDKTSSHRPHKVSAFSLMREDIVRAQNEGDYRMLFSLLSQICCDPEKAQVEMFRRMLFNIAINNTDDHLKNFEVLLDEKSNCYALSPAYDLTIDPYPNPRITSVFGLQRPTLSNDTLEHILAEIPFSRQLAYQLRDDIVDVVSHWRAFFREAGVDMDQINKLEKCMSRTLHFHETVVSKPVNRNW